MATAAFDFRELKNFRLQHNITKNVLQDVNHQVVIIGCDSLHPKERIVLRDQISRENLKLNFVLKRTSRLFFNNSKLNPLKNLFEGNIIYIKNTSQPQISINNLKFLLNNNKFTVRLLISNNQLYRSIKIKNLVLFEQKNTLYILKILMYCIHLNYFLFLNLKK